MTAVLILMSNLCAAVIAAAVVPLAYAIVADARERRDRPPGRVHSETARPRALKPRFARAARLSRVRAQRSMSFRGVLTDTETPGHRW